MSSEWVKMRLGDFMELKRGYDLPKKSRSTGSIPLVSSAGVSDHHSEAKVRGPGVVTGRYGTLGDVFYIEEDFWPLNTTLYVRDFKGNDPRFTYYFLQTIDYLQYSDKAAVPGLNRNHLHMAEICVPKSVEQQRRIASVLSAFDDQIDANDRINQTLEQMAQAIFKSWFVDFEPVKAKRTALKAGGNEEDAVLAAMQVISGKVTEELAQMQIDQPAHYSELRSVAELFPSMMQESELGEIPEGWSLSPAQNRFDITIGKTPPRKESQWFSENPRDVKWLSIKKMGEGTVFVTDTDEYLTSEAVRKHKVKMCPPGTVLVSFKLTVGRVAIAASEMVTNEAIAHFRTGAGSPGSYWTYLWLRSFDFKALGSTSSIATAVNSKTIKNMLLVAPNDELLDRFERFVTPLFNEILCRHSNSRTLEELRDDLLPRLVSGELVLPENERLSVRREDVAAV